MKSIELGVNKLMIGTVQTDSLHKDGSEEFINSISQLLKCQEGDIFLEAPAIDISTSELIRISGIPSGLLAWAHSCHKTNVACGVCRGCNKYFEVFGELGYDLDRPRQPRSA